MARRKAPIKLSSGVGSTNGIGIAQKLAVNVAAAVAAAAPGKEQAAALAQIVTNADKLAKSIDDTDPQHQVLMMLKDPANDVDIPENYWRLADEPADRLE